MYSNVEYSGNDRESKAKRIKLTHGRQQVKTIVMHNHFANLERNDIANVFVDKHGYYIDGKSWLPKCFFPEVKDDLLLYLAVLGCWHCPVFLDSSSGIEYSTRHILELFTKPPMNESVNEVSRSGSYLENMLAIGVLTCSRRNGVEGITLDEFMEYFLGEFSDTTVRKLKLKVGKKEVPTSFFCEKLKEKKIPFLTPANGVWPRFIKRDVIGCLFGELVRPPRKAMCDLLIRGQRWFIGEAKNWEKDFNSAELYKIIMKRWTKRHWIFGLIVTNGIIKSMFGTERSENNEVRDYIMKKKINVVKVNCQSGEAQYLFLEDLIFGKDSERLLVILFNLEFDSEDEGDYEITEEEKLEINSDVED